MYVVTYGSVIYFIPVLFWKHCETKEAVLTMLEVRRSFTWIAYSNPSQFLEKLPEQKKSGCFY